MTREEAKKFIAQNQDAFTMLGDKVKLINTVKVAMTGKDKYMIEMYGRMKAIQIIEEWVRELWGIAYIEDLPETESEDDIYHIINKKEEL